VAAARIRNLVLQRRMLGNLRQSHHMHSIKIKNKISTFNKEKTNKQTAKMENKIGSREL
jgi:hypothetical protein